MFSRDSRTRKISGHDTNEHACLIMLGAANKSTFRRETREKGEQDPDRAAVPELVPTLNWVEFRTKEFGSEQKSLRA